MPIPTSKPFEKQTAKDRAYQQIKKWIIEGTLMPQEKLAEVELAKSIDVSRTPIREALLRLNEDGFVVMEAGKVTRVAPLNDDDIANLYEPMAVIEGLAANQAASELDETDLKKLANLEKKYRANVNSTNFVKMIESDRNFHQAILEIAGNKYEQQFSNLLFGHIMRYELDLLKKLREAKINFKNVIEPHDLLLKSLAEQNSPKASSAMTKDWLMTMRKLKSLQSMLTEE
ncbi:GntR family transcriptional regulator [Companilactobacillus versmoldensis]|uniref:Crp Fnr family transcriptional regulator n=1 Tax=Companilactobacillus versmoldensis DSM 14857 = KCTC 3814 TaxID=1423815 RepID=A0A0R1SHD0_9LACO|nr:GntR family transcriptional regulator [Companilactobacillus versmoldensis]KRL68201.1 Crp Fnr family transcriptional regulator [Companilactobacillus versmoldensis DSM 14857 = KCTC 3814]